MKRIVFLNPDGSIRSVRTPVSPMKEGETEGEWLARCAARNPKSDRHVVVDDADFETGGNAGLKDARCFRNAWVLEAGKVRYDLAKCRQMKTDELRARRDDILKALDVLYMRADEAGDVAEKGRIGARKQKLRDLPDTIQADLERLDAASLEAFEPAWPE